MNEEWKEILADEFEKPYYKELMQFVNEEYDNETVFPAKENIFNALNLTPFHQVKVVILGQDPYHGEGQAQGLSFSVPEGMKLPPSLRNIYKELSDDLGIPESVNGDLTSWANQGVLLLNAVLTVRAHEANSHAKHGWETFTDAIIEKLGQRKEPIVFILWGAQAKKKEKLIGKQHIILTSAHPSPLSSYRGFFGSKPFSKTNEALISLGESPIDWKIETSQTVLF
jgi:uracil-DNA glycosylase